MTAHVRIDEFQPENEDIEAYLERVDLYFLASGTKEADKVPLFLTVVGKKNYTLLRDLYSSGETERKGFSNTLRKAQETLSAKESSYR